MMKGNDDDELTDVLWVQGFSQPSSSLQHSLRQTVNPVHNRMQLIPPPSTLNAGFNCTLANLMADTGDLREGNCSTTASPRHHSMGGGGAAGGHHSNSSSMTLMGSGCISNSPFASPASSEGGPPTHSGRLSQGSMPYLAGLSTGFLPSCGLSDARDGDSSGIIKEENAAAAAYFSADTLDARDFQMQRASLDASQFLNSREFSNTGRVAGNNNNSNSHLLGNTSNMNSLFFNAAQQAPNRFGQRAPLPNLMMLSTGHPFLQEQRASNQNTPLGSPRLQDGPG